MSQPYLEVTYRNGKRFAAYLYLSRQSGDRTVRTQRKDDFLIGFAVDGRAIGIELTTIATFNPAALNQILLEIHQPALTPDDLAPLTAA